MLRRNIEAVHSTVSEPALVGHCETDIKTAIREEKKYFVREFFEVMGSASADNHMTNLEEVFDLT